MDILLEVNSELIRSRLAEAGLSICPCCTFDQSVWLHCSPIKMDFDIHGIGYQDEEFGSTKVEDELFKFLSEHKRNLFNCGFDVNKFIVECKRIKGKSIND